MRLQQEETKHVVQIKTARRDDRKTIEETTVDGKKRTVANKMFGKIVYTTVESIDVYEAKDEEVITAVQNGLRSAAKK